MVQPVQRPRGPEGHSSCYEHLPWPSDVTQQQIDSWLVEFRDARIREPVKPKLGHDKFWVVAPDWIEPLSIDADSMEVSADAQTITLRRQGELVASMPITYFCVKDRNLTVHK
ncbi:hypothetical protein [Achromobacter xylosoxidans]|uniref:hypothetical protein n=1 Tax=Alcaligenes xylosoxydans xylosoxydans TaxID=85698 RepID=UPI001F143DA7|nr:hypothetical protein [Achromobacter xylosoxidans]